MYYYRFLFHLFILWSQHSHWVLQRVQPRRRQYLQRYQRGRVIRPSLSLLGNHICYGQFACVSLKENGNKRNVDERGFEKGISLLHYLSQLLQHLPFPEVPSSSVHSPPPPPPPPPPDNKARRYLARSLVLDTPRPPLVPAPRARSFGRSQRLRE